YFYYISCFFSTSLLFFHFCYSLLNPLPTTSLAFAIIMILFLSNSLAIVFILAISPLDAVHFYISLFSFVYIPFPKIPVVPLCIFSPICLAISSFLSDTIINSFVK